MLPAVFPITVPMDTPPDAEPDSPTMEFRTARGIRQAGRVFRKEAAGPNSSAKAHEAKSTLRTNMRDLPLSYPLRIWTRLKGLPRLLEQVVGGLVRRRGLGPFEPKRFFPAFGYAGAVGIDEY